MENKNIRIYYWVVTDNACEPIAIFANRKDALDYAWESMCGAWGGEDGIASYFFDEPEYSPYMKEQFYQWGRLENDGTYFVDDAPFFQN